MAGDTECRCSAYYATAGSSSSPNGCKLLVRRTGWLGRITREL